jgi:Coenzyme PQQ synthesis protein D (PqqD)
MGEDMDSTRVSVNAPHVIHETIDGEVIVINLATGSYYSLKGSAAAAWGLIEGPAGVQAEELLEALAARFDAPVAEVEHAFEPFLAELRAEGLVSSTGTDESAVEVAERSRSNGNTGVELAFEPPLLEKFTDMQDLVLLDPVHEVDETGWPRQRTDGDVRAASNGH